VLGESLIVEPTMACVARWLIELDDSMLKVYVDEALVVGVRRPLDQSGLRAIHWSQERGFSDVREMGAL